LRLSRVRNRHGTEGAADLSKDSRFVQKKLADGLEFHIPFSENSYCIVLFCSRCGKKLVAYDCSLQLSVSSMVPYTYLNGSIVCFSCLDV